MPKRVTKKVEQFEAGVHKLSSLTKGQIKKMLKQGSHIEKRGPKSEEYLVEKLVDDDSSEEEYDSDEVDAFIKEQDKDEEGSSDENEYEYDDFLVPDEEEDSDVKSLADVFNKNLIISGKRTRKPVQRFEVEVDSDFENESGDEGLAGSDEESGSSDEDSLSGSDDDSEYASEDEVSSEDDSEYDSEVSSEDESSDEGSSDEEDSYSGDSEED